MWQLIWPSEFLSNKFLKNILKPSFESISFDLAIQLSFPKSFDYLIFLFVDCLRHDSFFAALLYNYKFWASMNLRPYFHFSAIDCEVTEWSEWSGCSSSCGKGTESRSRLISQHPSAGNWVFVTLYLIISKTLLNVGGDPCPSLSQKRGCLGSRCSDVHKKYKNPIRGNRFIRSN